MVIDSGLVRRTIEIDDVNCYRTVVDDSNFVQFLHSIDALLMISYTYLTTHIVPGPQSVSYFVPLLLLPIALLVPRSALSRWQSICLVLPLMAVCTYHAWTRMGGLDVISVDVLLWSLYLLALKDPWKDFRYIGTSTYEPMDIDHDGTGNRETEGVSYPTSFSQRLIWAGTLLASIRLNGWLIGNDSHDDYQIRHQQRGKITRAAFIRHGILSFVRGYLVLDLTCAYQSHDPYFKELEVPITSPLPFSGLPPRFFRALIMGAQVWALISQFIYLPCCFLIAFNAANLISDEWSPHTWQPLFGPSSIVLHRGIRGFWGQYWHQSMRPLTSGPGEAIANVSRLKKKGLLHVAIVTTIAFGLSGIIHTGLVPPGPLYANIDVNDIRLLVAAFFWSQSIIIICEVAVVRLAGSVVGLEVFEAGVGMVFKMIVNAVIFVLWFTATLPVFGEAARQLGYWRVWLVPVSLWRGLKGEGWMAWSLR